MAELGFPAAQRLARTLLTIGHPLSEAAINATAGDLVEWCKGLWVDGRPALNPEQQAQALITEARRTWDGWPKEGGTKQLLALFHHLFTPQKDPNEQRRQWERDYGPPDKSWSEKFIGKTALLTDKKKEFQRQMREMILQGIRDAIHYTEGKGRFDFEEEHGDSQETRRQKRFSESFWTDAMRHYNAKHPETVAEIRQEAAHEA